MKNLIFISSLFCLTFSFGQNYSPIFGDTLNTGHQVNISSFNYYASTSFNNNLTNKFIFGGNIDTELKNFNQSNLRNSNATGGKTEQKIEYVNYNITPFKTLENYGLIASLEDINLFSSNISTDLYNSIFYGNQNYLGDTMDFSYSHLQHLHYQKISIGLVHKKLNSSLKLGFIMGNKSIDYRLGDTWINSSPTSDSIQVNLNGEGHYSDSTSNYFEPKGYGFSFDFEHNIIYKNKKGKSNVINFTLGNIGVIFWNSNTNYHYVDSKNTYSGFDIRSLINRDTSKTLLSMDTLGILSKTQPLVKLLPFELSMQKLANRFSDQKFQLIFGLKAIILSDYKPYMFVGAYYSPNQKIGISSRLAYGGFGGFKGGINANYWIKDKLEIAIGTYDVVGFISKKYGYGKSLHLSANLKF